ncbi:hypothetical protein HII12_003892 [Brettanomyces bruxellensis]|uniref:Uncharacterized protein n=1 Tax=Dekkera bruxellensis TaxID=5007 RepID=A0A8H6BBW6_DEKBR|nr:hypothetical protein HII12_003892 [Brettanomyces bruxellensis]
MYIKGEFNPADMLTKSLNKNTLEKELKFPNNGVLRSKATDSRSVTHVSAQTSIDFEKKRKYELIKTQRLNEIKQSLPQDRVYDDANRITRYVKIGLFTIIIFFGSATLYAGIFRRNDVKTWLYERRGVKTSKKEEGVIPAEYFEKEEERLNRKNAKVDNPNDSSEPGVYICGNNGSSLVCDNGRRKFQTVMKRLKIFDHKYARYVALGSKSGVLIDDKGDLFQWGDGFGGDSAKASLKVRI